MTTNMQRIEIYDVNETGALSFDLKDILQLVEPKRLLRWFLLEFEATGELNGTEAIIDLEKRVADNPHGVEMKWEYLVTLSLQLDQTINATLVGMNPGMPPPSIPLSCECGAEIIVEAVDSSFWAISTYDLALIEAVNTRFKKTRLVIKNRPSRLPGRS